MTRLASMLALLGVLAAPFMVPADDGVQKVHVVGQTRCGAEVEVVSDVVRDTLTSYTPFAPPEKAGWTFVYWTGYPNADSRIRGDFWTYPRIPTVTVYGEMTLTANYVPTDADSNGNGIPDWQEIYWNVEDFAIDSDRDGDGYGLKDELNNGTNPWLADSSGEQGISYADTGMLVYNPSNRPTCVIRSEPEGMLFDTISNAYVAVGTRVTTPSLDPRESCFAYWTVNGVRQVDEYGVALKQVNFDMPNVDTIAIAVMEDDEARRMRLYYYGTGTGSENDDTDGDGVAFRDEVTQGTSPTFSNAFEAAGISYAQSGLIGYNPNNLRSYIVRSEPDGMLFDTVEGEHVSPGTVVSTSVCNPRTSNFAYWVLNGVRQCDQFGVALDCVTTVVTNQDVELVAVTEENEALRMQLYWHSTTMDNAADLDGDGFGFGEEMAQGTNPNFVDSSDCAGISYAQSGLIDYNPNNLHRYIIRSEPEGALFDTVASGYVAAGTRVATPTCSPVDSTFAYWTLNGVRQCDEFGIALQSVETEMANEDIELLAVTVDDEDSRIGYFWYGGEISADVDTDDDGYDLQAEHAQGSSPVFSNATVDAGIAYGQSGLINYNPNNLHSYIIKSDPEGELFDTVVSGFVTSGTLVVTPECDPVNTTFAYWTVNGVRQTDVYGVALRRLSLTVGNEDMEIVAVTAGDETVRNAWYWYGEDVDLGSDTDGDGLQMRNELAQGTSPVFSDATFSAGIGYADSGVVVYNPSAKPTCIVRCDPEGVLFDTVSMEFVEPGTMIASPDMSGALGGFACWMMNGVPLRDEYGRAKMQVSFAMPGTDVELIAVVRTDPIDRASVFWYGYEGQGMASDTDGDGFAFVDEIAAGTIPTFKNETEAGGVAFADTETFEVNLQPYEQVQGAVMDGAYSQLFTSPVAGNAATSETFGGGEAIWPVVADVNDDGLWDFIVVSESTTNVFLNVGSKGNPEFVEGSAMLAANVDFKTNGVEKLDRLLLDVAVPADALSATYGDSNQDGTDDLLVSDGLGRIWYYKGSGEGFILQHKVWGGSYAGFAQGLRLAAVDWEDDGDLDCLAGTADGKLMLLRDPKVGRPTNVRVLAGVDNILLTWDPNAQSRIRGYRVYRAAAESDAFARIAQPQLPTYRDFPGIGGAFDYKVSSVSRFYTAGNSMPTETESMPTEAIRAELGNVRFFWNDVSVKLGEQAAVMLSIENSMNYDVAGKTQVVAYDPAYLTPVKIVKSGITENVTYTESVDSAQGRWSITLTGGTLAAGGGKFLTLVFDTAKEGTTTVGEATVEIVAIPNTDPAEVPPYSLGDVNGDGKVDVEDLRLLAKHKNGNGRKYTADQLRAGDFNGNGKLDNADYQALRALLKGRGAL